MKTVADLFANNHVRLGKASQSDRHFVHVEKLPADGPDGLCTWVKSVEPGQLQNEYWVARERNLLLLLKKFPQVARLRKDDDNNDSAFHTVRTRDAGIPLDAWMKMRPQHIASGQSLEHPFAHIGSFLRLTRGLLTALKAIHREGVVHANLDAHNICLPYHPVPFHFDGGIRPDYTNVCLIDFMFAVSSTLRLYRPLAIKPLAPPSIHSAQLRRALEADHAAQHAEHIQDIDYSVDLYALGHLLEEIFQRGILYPANMQSQMEMTIYNLIHELLGFDDGIPDNLTEKYGSSLPHDVYIKRIDNMLSLDPHADNDDHDLLLLDPGQSLDEDEQHPDVEILPLAEPHQPGPDTHAETQGDPLLMTASAPLSTPRPEKKTGAALSSYFEINKWLVVAVVVVLQILNFIYHDGDKVHLDIFMSILLTLGITGGLLGAMLLLVPRDRMISFTQGEEDTSAASQPDTEAAMPVVLSEDQYIQVSPLAVIAIILTLQLAGLFYMHGDGMGLDVLPTVLLTLVLGLGLAAAKVAYDRFVTPKPIKRIADDEDEPEVLPAAERAAADTDDADTSSPAPIAPAAVAMAAAIPIAATAMETLPTGDDNGMATPEPEPILTESGAEDFPVMADAEIPPQAPMEDTVSALTSTSLPVIDAELPAVDIPTEAGDDIAEAVVAAPASDDEAAFLAPIDRTSTNLPVVDLPPADDQAPAFSEAAPVEDTVAPVSLAETAPVMRNDDIALPLAARVGHDESSAADDMPELSPSGEAVARKHLELDNRIVIVVVILLLLLFFYLSMPDRKEEAAPTAPAATTEVPEITEAANLEDTGLPEVPPLTEETATSVPTDNSALDDLVATTPAATAPRTATPRAARAAVSAPATDAGDATAAVKPAKPAKAAKTAKAGKAAAGDATAAGDAVETAVEAAPETTTEAVAAAETPAAKPAEKPAEAAAPVVKPLGNSLAQAQNVMGWHYFKGINVPKDNVEALRWFQKAANMGDASGQFNLGMMYANGYGIARNHAEAARWFKLAADQGKANAQLNLGLMYLSGRGVTQNSAEGLRLLRLSADQGDKNAQAYLDSLNRNNKPAEAP